jgi:hypothetical protein
MLAYPDGGRLIIGADAIQVPVEPTLYRIDAAVLRDLDARINPAAVVAQPARPDHEIPTFTWASRRHRYRAWWRSTRRDARVRYRTREFLPGVPLRAFILVALLGVGTVVALINGRFPPIGLSILVAGVTGALARRRR